MPIRSVPCRAFVFGVLTSLVWLGGSPGADAPRPPAGEPAAISLAGTWRFQLDRSDAGIREAWFQRRLPDSARLPGTLTEQGIGDPITLKTPWIGGINDKSFFQSPEYQAYREPGKIQVPFWLQPELYYAGAAWFQRDLDIPANWAERRVVLSLERTHWESQAWIDGRPLGVQRSLFTPHAYDLGTLAPGKHVLTLRIDNRMIIDIGENSHAVSDHTQGNWNGVVGRIELRSTPRVWIESLQVDANPTTRLAKVKGKLGCAGAPARNVPVELRLRDPAAPASAARTRLSVSCPGPWTEFEAELPWSSGFDPWHEFSPRLYTVDACVGEAENQHTRSATFGVRPVAASGTRITLTGQPIYLRGTLECAIFPKTGHPPMEREEWLRILRVARNHGLNHLRFHSWCPPESAFATADELGFYFQIETCWANQSTTIGDGKPVDRWVHEETERILEQYGNHPSFLLMAYGNEPGGKKQNAFLTDYVTRFKARDPRRLWTSGSGWPELPVNQYHVSPAPRIQQWGQELKSRINAAPPATTADYRDFIARHPAPVISHEIGQWCVYPNFEEIAKYTGYLKPKNFEIFRDRLRANGLGHLAQAFLIASGKLQTLCYKEEIESALRTPGMGGFELLDLHDFPGQGTALVGVLDPFWEEKGYVTAQEFHRFCGPTVPLARLAKRVFTAEEPFEATIELAHFGPKAFQQCIATATLMDEKGQRLLSQPMAAPKAILHGALTKLGRVAFDLKTLPVPARYRLLVEVAEGGQPPLANDWDIWVYPSAKPAEPRSSIHVSSAWDDAARQHLAAGGKLLLTLPGSQVRNFDRDPVRLGFSSIFWNTAWTNRQAPTTLGLLCDPQHPALARFPTESHVNWQWWYLIHRAGALRMDQWPAGSEPIVRVIDDWVTARSLGLIAEARVGSGQMIVCGFDLFQNADDPVSRQMRESLLAYMESGKFQPRVNVTEAQIAALIAPNRR